MKKRVNSANLIVKESIETALAELMKKKPFGDITVTEIVEKAGVSRVSYYRNYYYKEDVLFSAMDRIATEWKERFDNSTIDIGEKIIRLFEMERSLLEVVYKNRLEHLMYRLIRKYCGLEEKIDNNVAAYFMSLIAGAFYGWCDEWVRRGMIESPDRLISMIKEQEEKNKAAAEKDKDVKG